MKALNLSDFEDLARQKLPEQNFGYIASGSDDEVTLAQNRRAFEQLVLLPRVLVDVSEVETGVEILGRRLELPVLLAPAAFHALAHPEAEIATARAAAAAGTIFTVSTMASRRIEDVAAATDAACWFQLYCSRDREISRALIERAEAAGYTALVVTVDVPVVGRREEDLRNEFRLPPEALPQTLLQYADLEGLSRAEQASTLAELVDRLFDPTLSWKDLEWMRGITKLPILLKGVLHPADARRAVEEGVDGLIASNHGGRQLDTVPAAIEVLAEIVEAVDGKIPVLVDGGVRRGTDVVKALALGAAAVMIGRSYMWGLAVDGEEGVTAVLEMLRGEIRTALALVGTPRIGDLGPGCVRFRQVLGE